MFIPINETFIPVKLSYYDNPKFQHHMNVEVAPLSKTLNPHIPEAWLDAAHSTIRANIINAILDYLWFDTCDEIALGKAHDLAFIEKAMVFRNGGIEVDQATIDLFECLQDDNEEETGSEEVDSTGRIEHRFNSIKSCESENGQKLHPLG